MIRVPAPANVNGDQLAEELAAAGVPDAVVVLVGDHLEVAAAADTAKTKVETVVKAHTPAPPVEPVEPLSDAEITALRALLATK